MTNSHLSHHARHHRGKQIVAARTAHPHEQRGTRRVQSPSPRTLPRRRRPRRPLPDLPRERRLPDIRPISAATSPSHRRQQALNFINATLYRGLTDASDDAQGNPIIEPRYVNPNLPLPQPRPIAWMSPQEAQAFEQDLETIQHARQTGHCEFDSWHDDNGNLYTRCAVAETAPDDKRDKISQAMHRASRALHEGSAVRVPLPEGGIMYMARWDLRPTADPTSATAG